MQIQITSPKTVGHCYIDFSRSGWQQFSKLNRQLGARFIRGIILRHELKQYIVAHEAHGIILDTECHELRYDDGIHLILKKMSGTWYITDIWTTEVPSGFEPVYVWTRVKLGWKEFIVRVMACWRSITSSSFH